MRDPDSDLKSEKFLSVESGIRENFASEIRNPVFWNPEYRSKNPESHKRLEPEIQGPLTKSGVHGVESKKVLDFLTRGDPVMDP